MKIIDELYEAYRSHLTGKKEDFEILTLAFLEEMDRESLLECINELTDPQLYQLVGLYVMQHLQVRYKSDMIVAPIQATNQEHLH